MSPDPLSRRWGLGTRLTMCCTHELRKHNGDMGMGHYGLMGGAAIAK